MGVLARSMLDERELESLIDASVIVDRESDISLAPTFVDAVDAHENTLRNAADADHADVLVDSTDACDSRADANAVTAALDGDTRRLARFLALDDAASPSLVDTLRYTLLVERFERPAPPTDGAPAGFLSLHGDQLPLALALSHRTIVYVWREDCDPCDTMRDEFEDAFGETGDDELGLYAIYGPEAAEFLYDRYDVAGAPTTLFVLDGTVDCRLEGAHYRSVIDSEIETLRSLD
jgi:hypothetical protein